MIIETNKAISQKTGKIIKVTTYIPQNKKDVLRLRKMGIKERDWLREK